MENKELIEKLKRFIDKKDRFLNMQPLNLSLFYDDAEFILSLLEEKEANKNNLDKLDNMAKMLDEALQKETPESLREFLDNIKRREQAAG